MIKIGKIKNVWWVYQKGKQTESDWNVYIDQTRKFLNSQIPGSFVTIDDNSSVPNATIRRKLADCMEEVGEEKLKQQVHCSAILTHNQMTRCILKAVQWLAPKPFPEKIFASSRELEKWVIENSNTKSNFFREIRKEVEK